MSAKNCVVIVHHADDVMQVIKGPDGEMLSKKEGQRIATASARSGGVKSATVFQAVMEVFDKPE